MAQRSIAGLRGILTGASSGIGAALARELVGRGCRLVLVARRREQLDELAGQLQSAPGQVVALVGDVTDPAVRSSALDTAQERFGGLDLLVNNAGIGALGRFAEAPAERLRQIMEVNFFAAAELTRAAIPLLKSAHTPIVVNVGSILGHRGIPRSSEYCASKFALRGWSESLRAELAPCGIDLLLVSPGTTRTEFFDHALARESVPWENQAGVTPEFVAQRTVWAIERGRHEVIVSARGKALVWLNRLCPRLLDRVLARYG
jgi:short-subunit dehydrogenase